MRVVSVVSLAAAILAATSPALCAERRGSDQGDRAVLGSPTMGSLQRGFAQPDMIFAPFCFWFWDEPLDPALYPAKPRDMALKMLEQRINPGYAHARVSMADLLGPKAMAPSPRTSCRASRYGCLTKQTRTATGS